MAEKKISQLDETLTPVGTDLLEMTVDPAGTPLSKKVTVSTLFGAIAKYFKTISVSGQSDVVADTIDDTLTLAAGSGIAITTNATTDTITIAATGGGAGDVSSNTATSVDSEIALFSGTGGKTIKRATTTGILKGASGVLSAATAGTDYYNPGGTDVAVADGGTGSSTASGARTNLGLVIGTDVQAYDSDLAAVAGLSANGIVSRTGTGAMSARTITDAGGTTITNGGGVAGDPTILAKSRTLATLGAAASTSGTGEDTLLSYTMPANTMGANGTLFFTMFFSFTNNANAKTLRINFGGTVMMQITGITGQASLVAMRMISNQGATNAQVTSSLAGTQILNVSGSAPVTATVNTTASVLITITGECANAGDTITLQSATIDLKNA